MLSLYLRPTDFAFGCMHTGLALYFFVITNFIKFVVFLACSTCTNACPCTEDDTAVTVYRYSQPVPCYCRYQQQLVLSRHRCRHSVLNHKGNDVPPRALTWEVLISASFFRILTFLMLYRWLSYSTDSCPTSIWLWRLPLKWPTVCDV